MNSSCGVCVCVCCVLTWLTGSLKLVMRPARRDDFSSSERALKKKREVQGVTGRKEVVDTKSSLEQNSGLKKYLDTFKNL